MNLSIALIAVLAELQAMPGVYVSVDQVVRDEYPTGEIKEQTLPGLGGQLWIDSFDGAEASLAVEYPGASVRYQKISATALGRIRVTESNSIALGCDLTLEVPELGRGYAFTLADVSFSGGNSEDCLRYWVYPLMGDYQWSFDAARGSIEVSAQGPAQDPNGLKIQRRATLRWKRR